MQSQSELNFDADGQEDGLAKWIVARQQTAEEIAMRLGLPIGHKVEVWLRGSIRLVGKLRLKEELLIIDEQRLRQLPLVIDGVVFAYGEMESCVRCD
jgi:hypothetical protein